MCSPCLVGTFIEPPQARPERDPSNGRRHYRRVKGHSRAHSETPRPARARTGVHLLVNCHEHMRGNLVGIPPHAPLGKCHRVDRVDTAARLNFEAQVLFAGVWIGAQQGSPAKAPGPHGRSLDHRETFSHGPSDPVGARSASGGRSALPGGLNK